MIARLHIAGASALFCAALLSGCKKPVPHDVIARVGDREIRVEEFAAELRERQGASPVKLDPRRLLDESVEREIFVQTARHSGLESDREIRELIRDILVAKLKERVLTPQLEAATVSDAEVAAAYEKSRVEFTTPERVHLAVLFQEAPAGADAVGRQRLGAAQSRAQPVSNSRVESFGALAVEFSQDQETRYRGGDIGWVERGRHPQRIDDAVIEVGFALPAAGAMSDVIWGKNGVYLVKLIERRAPAAAPLASVEPAIRARLLREKREKIESAYLEKVRAAVPVELHPELLPASAASTDLPPKLP